MRRERQMTYSTEEKERMQKKLKELKSLLDLQIEMGEDTTVVSGKIRELEQVLQD